MQIKFRLVFIVGVALLCIVNFADFRQPAALQEQEQSSVLEVQEQVSVPELNVSSITGGAGQTIPMDISVTGAAKNLYGFILVRGIPSQFKLSNGFMNGNDWLVSLSELETLRLVVPDDFEGRFNIEVIFVFPGSEQRQTQSASVAIQREPALSDGIELSAAQPPRAIWLVPEKSITEGPAEVLESDGTAAAETGAPPIVADIKPQPQIQPIDSPNSDKVPTERDVVEFCSIQRQICRKICNLRFRNDVTGCPNRCDSLAARCSRTGCYKWRQPEFVFAGSYGGQQCLQ